MSSANDEEPQGTNTAGTSATILLSAQLRAVQRLHRATAQNRLIRTSRVLRTSASPPDSQGRPYVLPRNRTHLDPLPSPTSSFGSFESYLPPNIGGPNQQASICLDLEVMVQDVSKQISPPMTTEVPEARSLLRNLLVVFLMFFICAETRANRT